MNDKQSFDIKTAVKLLAPSEVGITLVPLTTIENSDHAFFWAAVFLSLSTCLLGSGISLFASEYPHVPLVILLLIFGVLFLVLFGAFSYRGHSVRKEARSQEMHTTETVRKSNEELETEKDSSVFDEIQKRLDDAFGDQVPKTREEVFGIFANMSSGDVHVETLGKVIDTLLHNGWFEETEKNGRKLMTYTRERDEMEPTLKK